MGFLWEWIPALEGRTLTTARGREFDITAVNDRSVEILVRSSGRTYRIYRREFDKAEGLGLTTSDVRPSQLRKAGASEGHPAYVAAIIHEFVRERR